MPSLLPHDLCHGWSSSLAPGSDRILVELFQILKDDAVESAALNMQYTIYTQYAICRLPAADHQRHADHSHSGQREKMLSTADRQRHADHSHSEASPHTRQDGCRQRQQHQKQQTLVSTQRNGSPGTLLLVMQLGVAIVENSMEIPQNAKSRTTLRSSNATPGSSTKRMKMLIPKYTYTPMFIAALFTTEKIRKQRGVYQQTNG